MKFVVSHYFHTLYCATNIDVIKLFRKFDYKYCNFHPLTPSLQLQYKDTLQEGAALRVTFPHTEDGHVDLQVGVVIEAALKVLQPTQTSSTVDSFYRQQAWGVIQVRVDCMFGVGVDYMSGVTQVCVWGGGGG